MSHSQRGGKNTEHQEGLRRRLVPARRGKGVVATTKGVIEESGLFLGGGGGSGEADIVFANILNTEKKGFPSHW